jgi:peptidoglycan biosynthesis protein MviN/MurJ (putative lipid II flippase)
MFSTSGYVGATQLYNIVLTSASSFLPEGSFALFNYVLQISNKVKSIVLTPVSTVFFSKFSSAVAEGQQKQTKRIATPIVGLIVFAGLQVSYIILIGDNLLRVLWESRTMTLSDFRLAYIMLCFNFVGALTASVNMILRKSTVAYGFADKLYRWWIIAQLLSAAYTYLAINYLDIYGLATVIMVNTFLILMTTYYVATKYCIDLKEFITSILDKKAYVYFTLMSIFTALVFRLSGLLDSNSIYWEIFSRAVSFTLFIGIAFGLFFRKERGVLFDKINMVIQGKSLRP